MAGQGRAEQAGEGQQPGALTFPSTPPPPKLKDLNKAGEKEWGEGRRRGRVGVERWSGGRAGARAMAAVVLVLAAEGPANERLGERTNH